MKKLYQNDQQKRYNRKCQRREKRKNQRNRHSYLKTTKEYKEQKKKSRNKETKTIKFPKDFNFSLIENTEELLKYFNQANEYSKEGYRVFFDLRQVTSVTPDAIAVFISWITDNRIGKNNISGNLPDNEDLRLMFFNSGFFKYVSTSGNLNQYQHQDVMYNIKTATKVNPKNTQRACKEILSTEENIKIQTLNLILMELMANTTEHADLQEHSKHQWCLYSNKKKNRIQCTFIDVGVGVFESATVKKYKEARLKIKDTLFFPESNASLLEKILKGEVKKDKKTSTTFSRTLKKNRGKGMPFVYQSMKEKNEFSRLIFISNDVFADIKVDGKEKGKIDRKTLKNTFSGTFYYWEMQKK